MSQPTAEEAAARISISALRALRSIRSACGGDFDAGVAPALDLVTAVKSSSFVPNEDRRALGVALLLLGYAAVKSGECATAVAVLRGSLEIWHVDGGGYVEDDETVSEAMRALCLGVVGEGATEEEGRQAYIRARGAKFSAGVEEEFVKALVEKGMPVDEWEAEVVALAANKFNAEGSMGRVGGGEKRGMDYWGDDEKRDGEENGSFQPRDSCFRDSRWDNGSTTSLQGNASDPDLSNFLAHDSSGEDDSGGSDGPPSLACSDSDSEEAMDNLGVFSISDDEGGNLPSRSDPPTSTRKKAQYTNDRSAKQKTPAEPAKVLDYDSDGSSFSDEEDRLDMNSLQMEGGDSTSIDHCRDFVRGTLASYLGKQFLMTPRSLDFDRFFMPHVAAPGTKKPMKKGKVNKGKKPQRCNLSCSNCWARKMWRARFPWTPLSIKGGRSTANATSYTSSPNDTTACDDPIPEGLSSNDILFFKRVGGFGSGRELFLGEVPAMVHALAFVSLLQIEISWREAVLVPCVKDAQFVFRQILEACCVESQIGFPLCNLVCELLASICCTLRDKTCEGSSAHWNVACRASPVIKEVTGSKESSDGLPRIDFRAGMLNESPVILESIEASLYAHSSAWERVGRIKREEEMVIRSMTRDATCFGKEFDMSGGEMQSRYFERWKESMRDTAFGNTRHGPSMMRVLRRSIYERSKFFELEVGDISILTGVDCVDHLPESCVPPSHTFPKLRAIHERKIEEAKRLLASFLPTGDESLDSQAAFCVHRRAVELLSEGIKRVSHSPRLYLKRGKRHLELGNLADASHDVDVGLARYSRLESDHGLDTSASYPELSGELLRLNAAITVNRLRARKVPYTALTCAEDVKMCKNQLEALRPLVHSSFRNSTSSDRKHFSGFIRAKLFVTFFEATLINAEGRWKAERVKASVRPTAAEQPSISKEPKPANLPSAGPKPSTSLNPAAEALAGEMRAKAQAEEVIPGMKCCFEDCDQNAQELRRKDFWAELVCVTGCESTLHKKCFRSFKQANGLICASCKKHPILGKVLYMSLDTAEEMRAKRPQALRSNIKRRSLQSEVSDNAGGGGDANRKNYFNQASSSASTNQGPASASETASKTQISRPTEKCTQLATQESKKKHCSVCDKPFNSNAQYLIHIESNKHRIRAEKAAKLAKRESQSKRAGASSQANLHAGFLPGHANPPRPWQSSREKGFSPSNTDRVNTFQSLANMPISDIPVPTQASSQRPDFGTFEAIAIVSKAIKKATAKSGRPTVLISQLEKYLDMSAFGVSDAQNYFLEHFEGLRKFMQKEQQLFWVSSFSFRQPNPEVGLLEVVAKAEHATRLDGHASASSDPPRRPSEASSSLAFPTLEESNLADLVGGIDVLQRMQEPVDDASTTARTRPSPFNLNRGASAFEMPRTYISPKLSNLKEGEEECGICLDAKGTHTSAPCSCQSLFCEPCLSACLEKWRAIGKSRCIGCGLNGQFTGIRRGWNN